MGLLSLRNLRVFAFVFVCTASTAAKVCEDTASPQRDLHAFRSSCYEFVEDSLGWTEAQDACWEREGELLDVDVKNTTDFFESIRGDMLESNLTWWLGRRPEKVPYMGETMTMYMPCTVLSQSDLDLSTLEIDPTVPFDDMRDTFILRLSKAVRDMSPDYATTNNETIAHIIACCKAIRLLAEKKCDNEINPNPQYMFEQIYDIYATLSILLVTDEPLTMHHDSGTIYQIRLKPEQMGNAVFTSESGGPTVKLPAYSELKARLQQYPKVIAQLGSFFKLPHPTNKTVDNVCSFSLSFGLTPISLDNLTVPVMIFVPNNATGVRNETLEMKESTALTTSFNITDTNVTVIFDIQPSENVSLLLLLAMGSPPNATNASASVILNQTDGYRWLVTPDMLEEMAGEWFLRVLLYNVSEEEHVEVQFLSFITKCMFWDTVLEEWSIEGCQVGLQSTTVLTQCLCTHLTLFGNSFFVMPNALDLSETASLFQTIKDNYVVLALLCTFFGLYIITVLWAWYSDRRALIRRKITVLEDNHPCASYNYLLSVQTGHRKNAGTSSNVTVRLMGAESESETQNLVDSEKPVFERGAVDMFLLATPYPLGELRSLRLQHDSTGGHPSWYINKVMVQDMQTRQMFQFLCSCWLSSDRGDGSTKKVFNAAKNNEIASFRNIFQNRTSTGFRDEHIWVSIVEPPWRSPFTRAQRVSCCMSSLSITWQEIMVGVQSGLLMFPINILIITIFRSIKPRLSVIQKKKDELNIAPPPPVTIPLILQETEQVVMALCRSPKNNVCALEERLESTYQLPMALDKIHQVLQLMQGEGESHIHWVFCSRYLLLCLAHLLQCLEKLDAKNFHSPADSQHLFDLTNQLLRKAEMVYACHKETCPLPASRNKKKVSAGLSLPWWSVFIAWFLLLSISVISTFFTLLYGLKYGKEKSIQWVISLGLSLFQSIFILQPLKVIGVAVFFALLLRPVAVEETDEVETGVYEQRTRCSRYTGRYGD
ncbi:hypothetical protein NHX12_006623 [Muraenolepis orangiensis]|uniref:PLAT domain-containing protein n=1 Tax=Muraenolepis orangiensis TaxID=630683 RepID=A0A9Q0DTY2_9TELE|nr:hypothetical protein NHX12_006623 [Muraenolepis orangiensis]